MSIGDVYTKQFRAEISRYFATWLPTATIRLGDYGILDGDYFEPLGPIAQLEIDFDVAANTNEPVASAYMNFVSRDGVSVTSKAAGETKPELSSIAMAKAGIAVQFSHKGAFLIEGKDMREHRMNITPNLSDQILRAFKDGRWKKNYALVHGVVNVPYADILISESEASSIELEAKGTVAELGKLEAELSRKDYRGKTLWYPGINMTPAFRLSGIKKHPFRQARVEPMGFSPSRHGIDRLGDGLVINPPAPEISKDDPLEHLFMGDLGEG